MAKKEALIEEEPHEEEEYSGALVYNMWINGPFTINVHEGGTVILQTGRPKDPLPGGGG